MEIGREGLRVRQTDATRNVLARAAAAVGIDALFVEVHDRPDEALSDGPNALPLAGLPALLEEVLPIFELGRASSSRHGWEE